MLFRSEDEDVVSVPYGNTDNVFVFWKRWAHDQRTLGSKGSYLNDLK